MPPQDFTELTEVWSSLTKTERTEFRWLAELQAIANQSDKHAARDWQFQSRTIPDTLEPIIVGH